MLMANLSSRGCICYHPVRTTTPVDPTVFLKTGMAKERSARNVMLNEKEYTSLAIHKNPNPKISDIKTHVGCSEKTSSMR